MDTDSDGEDANRDRLASNSMQLEDEWGGGVVDAKLAKALSKKRPGNVSAPAPTAKKKQKAQKPEQGNPVTPGTPAGSGEPSTVKVSTLCSKGPSCNVSRVCLYCTCMLLFSTQVSV